MLGENLGQENGGHNVCDNRGIVLKILNILNILKVLTLLQSIKQPDELLVGLGETLLAKSQKLDAALSEGAELVNLAIGTLKLLDDLLQFLHGACIGKLHRHRMEQIKS